MIGYLFPWRKTYDRIYNMLDLKDNDLKYLMKVINNSIHCLIKFINDMNIYIDNKILKIGKENIEIYFHYPNGNADIHLLYKIHKTPYISRVCKERNIIKNKICSDNRYRRYHFNVIRGHYIHAIFNILNNNHNILKNIVLTIIQNKGSNNNKIFNNNNHTLINKKNI